MNALLSPFLLQMIGSLVAILAIVWLVRKMGLGAKPRLDDEELVRVAAGEAHDGFDAVAVTLDRQGRAALARDRQGQIIALRPHGSHIAGRLLAEKARAHISGAELTVDTGERLFGTVVLELDDPEPWANTILRLSGAGYA